jgi:hypothetical protein
MDRYIVESMHTKEDCLHVLDLIVAQGHITHFDWGCESGVHSGWVIVEADSEEEALLSVPSMIRNRAHAVRLTKFTPEIIKSFHLQNETK